ncbi:diguanylate cyclase domain-containing protein [Alkalicoccus chagannorensis]|uniref:diguanylate cyclase domain-containing protein n=1 Tax=Alkalicoccus chagannorensis TaxID=427072 RepID=UPI00047AB173|nr:diguanylate cyclase [Alkalicoccus chagannorensis]
MDQDFYAEVVSDMPVGYAYQRMIYSHGRAVDYQLLDINKKMADILGIPSHDVSGSRMQQLLDTREEDHEAWVEMYASALSEQKKKTVERFSFPLKRWFRVQIIPENETYFSVIFIDITEEKEKITALDSFFNGNLGMMFRLNEENRLLEVNPEWTEVTGFSRQELLGTPLEQLIREDDRKDFFEQLSHVRSGARVRHYVCGIMNKNRSFSVLEWHLHAADGAIYGTAHDMTHQTWKEQQVQEREMLLEHVTDQMPGGIFQLQKDAAGTYSFPYHSDGFLDVFRVSARRFEQDQATVFTAVHHADYDEVMMSLQESHTRRTIWKKEFRITIAGNQVRWLRGRAKPSFYPDGRVIWHGHISDITEEKKQELALKESEERMRRLFSQVPGMLYQFDVHQDGTYRFSLASKGIWELIEVTPWEAYYQVEKVFDRIHPEDLALVKESIDQSAAEETRWSIDYRIIHPTHGIRWVRGNANPSKLDGRTIRFYGYIYDVTELIEKEEALKNREKMISEISHRLPGVIYQCISPSPGEYRFLTAAGNLSDLFGVTDYDPEQIKNMEIPPLIHPEDRETIIGAMDVSREQLTQFDETYRVIMDSRSEYKWIHAASTPEKQADGSVIWSGHLTDVTESRRNQLALQESEKQYRKLAKKMEEMAYHDSLTGLPNRRMLFDRLEQEILHCSKTGEKLGLLFIDLDNFKAINDQFGHDIGDQLLVYTAEKLSEVVRKSDIVARMAGDEFLVVFSHLTSEEHLHTAVSNMMNVFQGEASIGGSMISVKASIGAVLYPDHGSTVEELLSNADKAMYYKKRRGKSGMQLYEPEMAYVWDME